MMIMFLLAFSFVSNNLRVHVKGCCAEERTNESAYKVVQAVLPGYITTLVHKQELGQSNSRVEASTGLLSTDFDHGEESSCNGSAFEGSIISGSSVAVLHKADDKGE